MQADVDAYGDAVRERGFAALRKIRTLRQKEDKLMLYPDPPRPLDPLPDAIANLTDGEVAAELRRWRGGGAEDTWRPGDYVQAHSQLLLQAQGHRVSDPHPLTQSLLSGNDADASLGAIVKAGARLQIGDRAKDYDVRGLLIGGFGTDHLGDVLANTANRVVLETAPAMLNMVNAITRGVEVRDYRPSSAGTIHLNVELGLPTASDFQQYQSVMPKGQAETLALRVAYVRERITPMVVANDDVSGIAAIHQAVVTASMQAEIAMLAALLNNAVTLNDGAALFTSAAGNLLQGQSKDMAALNGAANLLRAQVRNGRAIDADPAVLVVPAADEISARKLVAEATGQKDWVAVYGSAYIDAGSWVLFADPAVWPVIVRGTLRGSNGQSLKFYREEITADDPAGSVILGASHSIDYAAVSRVGAVKIEVS